MNGGHFRVVGSQYHSFDDTILVFGYDIQKVVKVDCFVC